MTNALIYVFICFIAVIGACIGSFLNVVIWRVPEKMSLVSPPSHCPKCGKPIRWRDNIPVLSWFILRGKCRDCGAPISGRYPLVESASGLVALVFAIGILLLNWTGSPSQTFRWEAYSDFMTVWKTSMDPSSFPNSSESNPGTVALIELDESTASAVVDNFFHFLFLAVFYSILLTVVVDFALILGAVEYDKGESPASLVVASWIALIFSTFVIAYWGNEENVGERWITFLASAALGAVPSAILTRSKDMTYRLERATIGSIWGFCAGVVLALPGAILLICVDLWLSRKFKKNYFGIATFISCFLVSIAQISQPLLK